MEVNVENIKKLGFNYVCHDEDNDSDYSLNKPSKTRKGWIDLIVWHPKTKEIIVSEHTLKLSEAHQSGKINSKNITRYIKQKFRLSDVTDMGLLVEMLKAHNVL